MSKTFVFTPVGMDIWAPTTDAPPAGTLVRKINLPGCPKSGTAGHTHIETLDGRFAGLVLLNSLVPS